MQPAPSSITGYYTSQIYLTPALPTPLQQMSTDYKADRKMAEEKRSLLQRLQQWLFRKGKAKRTDQKDQKERRDEIAT